MRRHARPPAQPATLSFCSNDYLGLASRPAPPVASGSGASRLIAGERDEHRRLERAFATWLGVEDVLAFSSGYAANVGALSALAGAGDLIVSDSLNHASLIDGARLSRARVVVVPHGDHGAIERALARPERGARLGRGRELLQHGCRRPRPRGRCARVCDARGAALYVDEAHALGVLGPGGRGRCAEAGITPDVLVGTLGKAFGSQGAFVAGRAVLREWLWNRARSFVFSTGLAPVSAAVGVRALQLVIEQPALAARVGDLSSRLREGLVGAGAVASPSFAPAASAAPEDHPSPRLLGFGHVVPVVLGTPARALRWAASMREQGVDVHAIRPPTVPVGAARIRMTVTAEHSAEDVDRAVAAYASAARADAAGGAEGPEP